MLRFLRKSDAALLASVIAAICKFVPAEKITNSESYLELVQAVPDGIVWTLVGMGIGLWLFFPWDEDSRASKIWHWATDKFEVVNVNQDEPLSDKGNLISISALLRFRKATKGHLWLRVYHGIGLQKSPREEVLDLGSVNEPKGAMRKVEIVRRAIPYPGRTEMQTHGWGGGAQIEPSIMPNSRHIAVIELTGGIWTQRYKVFVATIDFCGNEVRPSLFGIGQDCDIWSTERK